MLTKHTCHNRRKGMEGRFDFDNHTLKPVYPSSSKQMQGTSKISIASRWYSGPEVNVDCTLSGKITLSPSPLDCLVIATGVGTGNKILAKAVNISDPGKGEQFVWFELHTKLLWSFLRPDRARPGETRPNWARLIVLVVVLLGADIYIDILLCKINLCPCIIDIWSDHAWSIFDWVW